MIKEVVCEVGEDVASVEGALEKLERSKGRSAEDVEIILPSPPPPRSLEVLEALQLLAGGLKCSSLG